MALGLLTGLAVQRAGLKRSMTAGLLVLATASLLGSAAESATWLLASRALEGLGFLWIVLPAPDLLRELVPTQRVNRMMGMWGSYMPLGTSLALLLGPVVMRLGSTDDGWRLLAALAVLLSLLVLWCVRSGSALARVALKRAAQTATSKDGQLLGLTLRSRPAWWLALSFAVYPGQWIAILGFYPVSMYKPVWPLQLQPLAWWETLQPVACLSVACRR